MSSVSARQASTCASAQAVSRSCASRSTTICRRFTPARGPTRPPRYFSASRAAILLSSRAMSWSKVPLASSCVNCLR